MRSQRQEFRPPPDVILPTAEDLEEIAHEADLEAGEVGPSQMVRGGLIFAVGAAITLLTLFAAIGRGGGIYVIAYGAVAGGFVDFLIGFENWRRGRRARAKDKALVPK